MRNVKTGNVNLKPKYCQMNNNNNNIAQYLNLITHLLTFAHVKIYVRKSSEKPKRFKEENIY